MNKELSIILRNKLAGLPFVDVLGGMVQTVTTEDLDENNSSKITKRFPVSTDVMGKECEGREIMMIPDSSRKSIIYFEDFGISATGKIHGNTSYASNIRLVCWLNRANLVGDMYQLIAGRMMSTIIDTIADKNPENIAFFTRLAVTVARIPPQDAGIFGRYTYSEPVRQYLRPPFEFFAIDLVCKFQAMASCLDGINWNNPKCY